MSALNITKVEIRYVPESKFDEVVPKAMLGLPEGYVPIEELEFQDDPGFDHFRRAISHPKNLETIYQTYQTINGTEDERCAQLRIRSMSWGDAIVYEGVGYYVGPEGFLTRAPDGTLTPVTES